MLENHFFALPKTLVFETPDVIVLKLTETRMVAEKTSLAKPSVLPVAKPTVIARSPQQGFSNGKGTSRGSLALG